MNTTLQSLKNLYVKLGGSLTDYYSDIADGIPVSDYVTIPDATDALAKLEIGGGGSEGGFVATFTTTLPVEDGTITNITCDKTYEEVMEAVQGEGAQFRLIDNLGRVTPSCGYYIDGENLVIVVNIFGIPNNTFGTMDVAGLNILYGGNSLTAEYVKAWIGLQGG